jgi:tetratricopeptide (TPR) repeat protein
LGILGLVINIKITQVKQEKDQKLTSLYSSAQQVATTGRWSEAISMYQEMEKLASTPEWSFKSKYEQSRTFIRMGSFPEAEKKLKEAEKVCQENPEILRGQNPKEALLLARKVLIEEQKQLEKTGVLTHPPASLDSGQANQTATASTPLDPTETNKRAEMTALFDDSRSLFQKKDYLGALQGLTKLESLSQEYPNFQFGVKKAIITSLLALKRFVEANEKLSEMESIVSSNATVRESPDVRNLMDAIRQEIQVARSESGDASHTIKSAINQKDLDRTGARSTQTTLAAQNSTHTIGASVKWSYPVVVPGKVCQIELVYNNCMPNGPIPTPRCTRIPGPDLVPRADVVEFSLKQGDGGINSVFFHNGSATILTYNIKVLESGTFTIPGFEVGTNIGPQEVLPLGFNTSE